MIRKTWLGMFVLVLVFQGGFQAHAQDVQKAEDINFRISDEPVQQLHNNYKNPQDITHVATIRFAHREGEGGAIPILFGGLFEWSPGNLSRSGSIFSCTAGDLLSTDTGKQVSPQQKAFWESESKPAESARPGAGPTGLIPPGTRVPGGRFGGATWGPPISVADRRPYSDEEGYICFEVAAVSEADARDAAKALMELLTARVNKQHKALLTCEESSKTHRNELLTELAQLEKTTADAYSDITEIMKNRNYRTLADAEQEAQELRNIVTGLEIRLAGSQEKIAAIERQKTILRTKDKESLLNSLEEMLIKENIELAGILASKNAATAAKAEADKCCTLVQKDKENQQRIKPLTAQVDQEKKTLERIQAYLIPVKDILRVANNEIVVSPVMRLSVKDSADGRAGPMMGGVGR